MPTPSGNNCPVALTKGQVAIVDKEDFDRISSHVWFSSWSSSTNSYYARSHSAGLMHRFVLEIPSQEKRDCDHRNGNSLDNRKENLRLASRSQNVMNSRLRSDASSGLKGATWHKSVKKWRSQIQVGGERVHLGYYSSAEDAHSAYCLAAQKQYGEFFRKC